MAEGSPEWKKPSDVMKLRRISSSGAVAGKPVAYPSSCSPRSSDSTEKKSLKRKNPFACSQANAVTEGDVQEEELSDTCKADVNISSQRSQPEKICVSFLSSHTYFMLACICYEEWFTSAEDQT